MDSPASLARSPPQYSKDLVSTASAEYKALLKQIASKTSAIDKLEHKTPKSIQHKIDLKLPQVVRDTRPNQANELQQRFNAAIQASQATMRDVIREAAKTELELLLEARRDFKITYESKLYKYFEKVFGQVRQLVCPDATIEFAPVLSDEAPALLHLTIMDLNLSLAFLNDSLNKIDYQDILAATLREQRQAERQAQRDAADAMELETSNEVLVAALVKQEVAKKTSTLNKEINQLRAALNASANRPGARDGAKPKKALQMTKKTSQQPSRNDGGRARELQLGKSSNNSTKSNSGRQQDKRNNKPSAKPKSLRKSGN
jgi:hypothetical protein